MRHEPMRTRAVEARLAQALIASARGAGIEAAVAEQHARAWASATFEGARHEVTLMAASSVGLGEWMAALPDAELPMRGHLVASVGVDRIEDDGETVRLTLTALTIEER